MFIFLSVSPVNGLSITMDFLLHLGRAWITTWYQVPLVSSTRWHREGLKEENPLPFKYSCFTIVYGLSFLALRVIVWWTQVWFQTEAISTWSLKVILLGCCTRNFFHCNDQTPDKKQPNRGMTAGHGLKVRSLMVVKAAWQQAVAVEVSSCLLTSFQTRTE